MKETMQEGAIRKVPADENRKGLRALLGFGAARKAADAAAPTTRKSRLEEEEKKAMGQKYAKGGMVRRGYGKARGA